MSRSPAFRRRAPSASQHPLLAWSGLAWKTTEMLLASAQVIAHRTARMAAAGPNPSARDRSEFLRMGQEKLEAAIECSQAVATHGWSHQLASATSLWHSMMQLGFDLALFSTSRSPLEAWQRQLKLAQRVQAAAAAHDDLARSAAAVSHRALAPLHRRTKGNVRRLSRVR